MVTPHGYKKRIDPLDLTFANHEAAFKSKTTWEVLRALLVYQLCSSQTIVAHNEKVGLCPFGTGCAMAIGVRVALCRTNPETKLVRRASAHN